jgi:hypothetical protein
MIIKNPERAKQFYDFTGMMEGNIQATDIDGFIEYKNKGYIILELKLTDKELPYGQKLAYERFIKDTTFANKKSIVFVIEHKVYDAKKTILVSDCFVREFYYSNKWRKPHYKIKAKDAIKKFTDFLDNLKKVN